MYGNHIADQFEPELPPDVYSRDEIDALIAEVEADRGEGRVCARKFWSKTPAERRGRFRP